MRTNSCIDLDLTMDPYEIFFLILKGRNIFFSKFSFCKRFFNYWQEFPIRAPLMTEAIFNKLGSTRLYYVLRVKLMVFMALAYFFTKILCFLEFCFHLKHFLQPNDLASPIKDSVSFLIGRNEARRFCQLLSNVCYDFRYICLTKISLSFLNSPLNYLISSIFGRSLSKNTQKPTFCELLHKVGNVFNFSCRSLCFDTTLFQFFCIFEQNCIFYVSSFCFLDELSKDWPVQLKDSIVGNMQSVRKKRIWIW